MPEDVKEDIEVEFEEVEVETEASKSEEFKEKAEKFREDFRTKAEARTEANKEKFDETLNKSKDVAGKVGENLRKLFKRISIPDTKATKIPLQLEISALT